MKHICETCGWWGDDDLSDGSRGCCCAECRVSSSNLWIRTLPNWRCNHHTALEAARTRLDIAARLLAGLMANPSERTSMTQPELMVCMLQIADALIAAAGEEKA